MPSNKYTRDSHLKYFSPLPTLEEDEFESGSDLSFGSDMSISVDEALEEDEFDSGSDVSFGSDLSISVDETLGLDEDLDLDLNQDLSLDTMLRAKETAEWVRRWASVRASLENKPRVRAKVLLAKVLRKVMAAIGKSKPAASPDPDTDPEGNVDGFHNVEHDFCDSMEGLWVRFGQTVPPENGRALRHSSQQLPTHRDNPFHVFPEMSSHGVSTRDEVSSDAASESSIIADEEVADAVWETAEESEDEGVRENPRGRGNRDAGYDY